MESPSSSQSEKLVQAQRLQNELANQLNAPNINQEDVRIHVENYIDSIIRLGNQNPQAVDQTLRQGMISYHVEKILGLQKAARNLKSITNTEETPLGTAWLTWEQENASDPSDLYSFQGNI